MPYKNIKDKRENRKKHYSKNRAKCCKQSNDWYYNNKEKALSAAKEWARSHPETIRNIQIKHNFGMTREEWNTLFESQDCKCAICNSEESGWKSKSGKQRDWHTDHIKGTKIVRGILCHHCNISLHSRDTPELLRKKADYIEKHNKKLL